MIELLVSVAILDTLATISIASFVEYKDRAYQAEAKAAFHDIQLAIESVIPDLLESGRIGNKGIYLCVN